MTMIVSARRRQADDLEQLLSGGRASTPEAALELAPLVGLARWLAPGPHTASADFRTALRERLVAEAAARVPAAVVPAQRARPTAPSRLRQAVAAVAVASVVTGIGAAAASTQALPGDGLYGLKRQIEGVQLDLARGDLSRGRELLQQADARLSEAEALAAGENGSEAATRALVAQALDDMAVAVTLGIEDLTRAYRATGEAEPLLVIQRFVADQQERLDDLRRLLDPSLRDRADAIAEQLAVLAREVAALLGTSSGDSARAVASEALNASGDGWAVGRLVDRAAATATGTEAVIGIGRAGAGGDRTTSATGGTGVEDVVDAVGDVSSGATDGGTTSRNGGGPGGVVDGVIGGGRTTSGPQLPPAPAPTVAVQPLPTPPPVTDPVGAVTPAVPVLPPVTACVPVPPLTPC